MAALAVLLALVLAAAAAHKVWDRDRLRSATARLLRLTPGRAAPFAFAAAIIEASAAILVLAPMTRVFGAALAVGLWALYGVALGLAWRRGETLLDCACSLGSHGTRIGRLALARPVALAGLAVIVALTPGHLADFTLETVPAGLALFGLYLAAGAFEALPPLPERRVS